MNSPLGAPKSPEAAGEGSARYATFDKGAVYWSPESGAEPVTGAIYAAWARSATSAARWACRPAARSRNRSGSCRTSSTAR